MKKQLCMTFLLVGFIVVSCLSVDPKPLPERFTQAWTLYDKDDTLCNGKIFYDYLAESQRINIVDAGPDCCGDIDESSHTCSFMQIKDKVYAILFELKLCCYYDAEIEIVPRDIFNYFQYKRERPIDGDIYYEWVLDIDTDFFDLKVDFYTDRSDKRILKRIEVGEDQDDDEYLNMDFWPGSYSEKFSYQTAFEIPKGCTDECDFSLKQKILKSKLFKSKLLKNSVSLKSQ